MSFTPSTGSPKSEDRRPLRAYLCGLILLALSGITTAQAFAGILEIRVKDHREAIGDFVSLEITIDAIRISPKSGLKFWQMGWRDLKPAPSTIDLTKYAEGKAVTVFRGDVAAGGFEALHLKLGKIEGVLKKGKSEAPVKNSVGPIKLGFSVRAKSDSLIILDLMVVDMSDHPPSGYELHLKGYEVYDDGKLVEKVPPG